MMLFLSWSSGDDAKLHIQIRKAVFERKWDNAIDMCRQMVSRYPNSLYRDDAMYWIGFCMEQKSDPDDAVFRQYQTLVESCPKSNWVDDAVIHQIVLAKRMVMRGREEYMPFLRNKASDPDSMIFFQAALALGELKDPGALPVLEAMARHKDENMARMSMEVLERYADTFEDSADFRSSAAGDTGAPAQPDEERHSVFRALQKKGTVWTENELFEIALVHVVPFPEMVFYVSLDNPWDKSEWRKKFWAPLDPTPTTPGNEAEEEFKTRVRYSFQHFRRIGAETADYPPWDSRGELYIKFGKPDRREKKGNGWEEWNYYGYKVNFLAAPKKHNADGKGIRLDAVSRYLYRETDPRLRERLLREPKFYYTHPALEAIHNIRDMEFHIVSARSSGDMILARFLYQFPVSNLKFRMEGKTMKGAYRCAWVVYDEDYRVVASDQSVKEISIADKHGYQRDHASGEIESVMAPGSYVLALTIEDVHSNRMGMYRKPFTAMRKGKSAEVKTTGGDSP